MIVTITPSIHRPWRDEGGFYSCEPFPATSFIDLSPSVEIRQLRDARGRWRRVRGVHESLRKAYLGTARAVRCRDPHGVEGVLVIGGEFGVLMVGVGDPGIGSPIIWVDDIRDVPAATARVLREDLEQAGEQPRGR